MATTAKKKGPVEPEAPAPIVVTVDVPVKALVYPEPGGGFSVVVPAFEGCYTQGETIEEVQHNIREAAELSLDELHDEGVKKWMAP